MSDRLTVHFAAFEFPCGNFVLKEQINLSKGPVLGLRQTEEAPSETQKVGASIEQSSFGTPIPSCLVLIDV
jgi:hypothetical protein